MCAVLVEGPCVEAGNSLDLLCWRQKKQLEPLDACNGHHTSLVSLLIPPGGAQQIVKVNRLLTQEVSASASIKSRVTRQAVQDALKSIQQRMKLVA